MFAPSARCDPPGRLASPLLAWSTFARDDAGAHRPRRDRQLPQRGDAARLRRAADRDAAGRGDRRRQRLAGRLGGDDRRSRRRDRPLAAQRRLLLRLQPRRRARARAVPAVPQPGRAHRARGAGDAASTRCERDPASGWSGRSCSSPATSSPSAVRRFPRHRSTFAQALFLHRLWPRPRWSDEFVRDRAAYEHDRDVRLAVRRVHADPPRALRGDRRLRRALLPLLRGHGPLPAGLGFRAAGCASSPAPSCATSAARRRAPARRSRSLLAAASCTRASTIVPPRLASTPLGVALGEATHAVTAVKRPRSRRGHLAALRAVSARADPRL